jgi:alpha-1,6-mannosyltransferase
MLAGFELAMTAVDSPNPWDTRDSVRLVAGCGLIALSWTVKLPSLMAMGFVGLALARRLDRDRPDRTWRNLLTAVASTGAIVVAVTLLVSYASGLGFGWLFTFDVGNSVRSWMSLSTATGVVTGFAGVLLGLGDHTSSILALTRPLGIVAAALVSPAMLATVYRGRLHPLAGLGIALGAVALGSPVVQPWYFLWGIVPLAAWVTAPAVRFGAVALSAVIAVMLMPSGADYQPFTIVEAVLATVLAVGLLVFLTRHQLPWWTRRPETLSGTPPERRGE